MFTHIYDLLEHVRIADILDVCVVTALVYSGLRWLRRRASRAAALCLLLVATLYVSAHVLDMYLTLSVFRIGLTVILLALIIVFQQDIRRGFEQLSYLPVRPVFAATTGVARELVASSDPSKVGVLVPENKRAALNEINTEPIEPSSVAAGNALDRNLILPPGAKWPDERAPKVTVRFQPKTPRDP
jgi:hypothetical protein